MKRSQLMLTGLAQFVLPIMVCAQWTEVWSDSFGATTLNDPAANPVAITSVLYGDWLSGGAALVESGELRVLTGGSGQNRGVAIALTGLPAGDYRLRFDLVSMYAQCTFQVSLYDGTSDGSSENTYLLDLLSAEDEALIHEKTGSGGLSPLRSATYVQADEGGTKELTLSFDGTGELVIVMDIPLSAAFTQRAVVDNMVMEFDGTPPPPPPPPSTPPAFGIGTLYRASAFVGQSYVNSIASSAYDSDEEAISYAKTDGPSWLVVSPDGSLGGIPSAADLGENVFTVAVSSDGGSDTATLRLFVVPAPQPQVRPNVLYILADDLGYMDVSAHEHPDLEFETPNIDSIFEQGVHFRAGFVSNSVCAPSRAGLMTGRYGSRFGYESNFATEIAGGTGSTIGLDPGQETLATMLKVAGYATFCVGKWHLGENAALFHPNVRGFDEFFGIIGGSRNYVQTTGLSDEKKIKDNYSIVSEPADMYITDFFTDKALDYIGTHTAGNPDQPWFLYMSYTAPHGPMDARASDIPRVPLVAQFGDNYTKSITYNLLEADGSVTNGSTANNDELRRIYGAMVLNMDDNIGRLLYQLGQLGIADKTLVIFHSDNGGPIKGSNWSLNRSLRGEKGSLWEGGVRVPFAIQWPGTIPSGQVIGHDVPVCAIDLMPTLAAVSGADQLMDIRTDGMNLMPLLRGRVATLGHRQLFWRRGTTTQTSLRSGDWKYYKNRNTGDEYLYDHGASANEWSGNQAATNPTKLAEMQAAHAALEAQMPWPHWNAGGELVAITTYDLDDAVAGVPYSMALTCSLPSGSPAPAWAIIDGKPSWLSIDAGTGDLSGTPDPGDPEHNLITLQVTSGSESSTYTVPLIVRGGFDPDDLDGDDLPDAWENATFGSTGVTDGGPSEDQDGDGFSDRDEYTFGTDPDDSSSFPVTGLAVGGNSLTLLIDGAAGRSYELQKSSSLAPGDWHYADNLDDLPSDGPVSLQADFADGTRSFFGRIVVK